MAEHPYGAAGGGVLGENPSIRIIEFLVTPFDLLVWMIPLRVRFLIWMLESNGLGFIIIDRDGRGDFPWHSLSGNAFWINEAADGLLLGDSEMGGSSSAVEAQSWGRIKASLGE